MLANTNPPGELLIRCLNQGKKNGCHWFPGTRAAGGAPGRAEKPDWSHQPAAYERATAPNQPRRRGDPLPRPEKWLLLDEGLDLWPAGTFWTACCGSRLLSRVC